MVFPASNTKEKAIVKGLPRNVYLAESTVWSLLSSLSSIFGGHLTSIKAIQICVSVRRGHITQLDSLHGNPAILFPVWNLCFS
jgi:hypothetical protein